MKKSMKWLALGLALFMAGCSAEDELSEYDRTQLAFLNQLNGNVSTMQWWKTSVTLNVYVHTAAPMQIWVLSNEEDGTLYDYRETSASGKLTMTVPQGKGTTMYVVTICNNKKSVQTVILSGASEESVDVYDPTSKLGIDWFSDKAGVRKGLKRSAKAATDPSLYGSSINGDATMMEWTSAQLNSARNLLDQYIIEGVRAETMGLNCNYELQSKGDFEITFMAGRCRSWSSHILGYYVHTKGNYDDIEYHDISETQLFDYLDGLAKVQYMVDETAANQYGVVAYQWYDANFDYGDVFDNPAPNLSARAGDDAYNSMEVFTRYSGHISGLRGVTFTVHAPAGKCVGFYDRSEDVPLPEQYDKLVSMGIAPYTQDRSEYKAMNFTCEWMNMNFNNTGLYRSAIVPYESVYWMGVEDKYSGGDMDCNDMIFGISSELDILMPEIVVPTIDTIPDTIIEDPTVEYRDKMPWTLAFEDAHREADFDFNDAVIKLVPDYENERCCVTVEAAGSTCRMYLHYDGPEGDVVLGEIHELLGSNSDTKLNTTSSSAQTPFVQVDCVPWPLTYSMANDAKRFYIEVKRGTCADCSDVIMLADTPGQVPEAILVAGEWKWPMEGVHIFSAYSSFSSWAKDVSRTSYWGWYNSPKPGSYVYY